MSSGSSSDVALSAAAHIRTLNRSDTLGSVGSAAPSSSGWSSFDGLSGPGSSTWGTQSAGFSDSAKASHCENAPFSAAFPSNRAFPSSNAGGAPISSNAPHVVAGGTINASTSTTTSGSSTSTAAGSVISSSAPLPAGDGARAFVNGTGVPAASANAPAGIRSHAGPMSGLTPQQIALLQQQQQQQQRGLLLQQQQQQLLQGLDQTMTTHHSYGNAQTAHSQSQTPFRQQFMQQHQASLPQSSNAYPSIPSTTNQQSQAALIIQQALMSGAAANAGNAYPQTSNAALLNALLAQQQQNNNKTNAQIPQQFGPRPGAQANANPLAGLNLNGITPALAAALLQPGQMSGNVNAPNSLHHLSGGYPYGQRLAQNQLQSEALIAMQRQHSGGGGLSSSSGALPHLGSGAIVGSQQHQQQQQQQMSQQQLQAIAQLSMLQNNQASGMNMNMSANANAKGNYSSGTTMGNLGGIGQLPAHQQVALLNAMQNLNGGNLDNAAQYMNGMKNAVAGQRNGNPFPGRANPPRPAGPTSSSSALGRIPSNGTMSGNILQHQMAGNFNALGQNQSQPPLQQPGGSNGTAAVRNSAGGMVMGSEVPPPLPQYTAAQTSESVSVQGTTRMGPGSQAIPGEIAAIDPIQTLREIGRTLAQLGITVEAAVNAGLLGGLSASDVRIVTDAHRVSTASGGAAQGKMQSQALAIGYVTADGGNVSRMDSLGNFINLNRKTDQGAAPVVHHHRGFEEYPGRYGMRKDHFAMDDAHRNQGTNSAPNPSSPTGSIGGMSAMSAPVANHKSSNEYRSLEMLKEKYGSEKNFDDAASSIQSALDAKDEVDALLSEIDTESYHKIKHADEMVLQAKMKESNPTFDATQYGFFDAQSNGSREGLLETPLNAASNSSDALSTADDVIENRPNKLSLKVLSSSQGDLEKMHNGCEMTEAGSSAWSSSCFPRDSLKITEGGKEGQDASAGRTRDCIGNWIAGLSLGTGF